ncbi:sugar ABC transporter permease [Paenibacillus sp. XY044]|uniref:ABC transporter permease n=1 Tax=Paenibacillus sp. XY044 TaxID=2026089 RepID=UPI00117EC06D|nr:ABC transporter permease subunit [Paenibacillus sp. XY044]
MGLSVNPAAKAARKPSALSNWFKRVRKHKHYLILLAPGIIYLLLFNYWPMFGITIAFKDFKLSEGIFGSDWTGLKWFRILFDSPDFWVALRNTLIISLYKLVFNFPAPIILALLLNEVFHSGFKRIIQTIVYFPHFVSWVILGGILFSLFSTGGGLLEFLGISTSPLMDPGSFRSLLVASDLWKEVGWGTIIYLAAITGISPDLYDAGRIDGANRIQLVWHITLPSIAGTIVVLLILRTGHILNVGFDQIFVLYNPLVYSVADVLETYVYRVGISMGRFSFATAAGMFQSVIGLVMLLITNRISKRLTGHGIW